MFAYGTLQTRLAPPVIRPAVQQLHSIGTGWTRGSVYDLGDYPGARFDGNGIIHGTVYQLPTTDEPAVWATFDGYGGVPDLFVRVPVPVTLAGGRTLSCWAYQYNHDLTGQTPIPSGRYARESRR